LTVSSYPVPPPARDLIAQWAQAANPAIIFDFNGTLSDDEPILFQIFGELFGEHLDWAMTADDYDRHLLGHSDREIVEKALQITGIDTPVDPLLELRKRRYRELVAHHNPITAETAALVRVLADHNVPMAIVTGAQRDDVRAVLDSSPVGEVITVVVAEEDVRRGKPDPEGFLAGAAALNRRPADMVVFEDSVPGVRGALAAGMRCIAVGAQPGPEVRSVAPAVVRRLSPDLVSHVLPALRGSGGR
jgi:beta-phosphoglucomutase